MERFIQDLNYGLRMLYKNRLFSFVSIFTLAIGIGANSAIFSIINTVLLQPLPYHQPDQIVQFWETNPLKNWTQATVAPANYLDWQKQSQSFTGMAAYIGSDGKGASSRDLHLTGVGEPVTLKALGVSGEIFSVLGVNALIGRTFQPEETWKGKEQVAVLSHQLWQRQFGGDAKIIGQTIQLNGRSFNVIGVMPEDFYFPDKTAELWLPFGIDPNDFAQIRRPHWLRVIARLKPGVTMEQARVEMEGIAARLEQQYPDTNTKMGVGLGPLKEWIVSDTRPALLVFCAAVAFVLLIACVNVANLMLVRAAARRKEFAVRAALGASRFRLITQLMTESLLLSVIGGICGILLALWFKDLLLTFSPGNIPRIDEIRIDRWVLGFTIALTVFTTFCFGLLPAWLSIRVDLFTTLKEGGGKNSDGLAGKRVHNLLVIAEVALATVLVISAGLMIKSFFNLNTVSPGFDADQAITFKLSLPGKRYPEAVQITAFYEKLNQQLKNLPGVVSVGATTRLPLMGYNWTGDMTIEGRPAEEYAVEIRHKDISPEYFQTLKTPLIGGRFFNEQDKSGSPAVVMINSALARQYFGQQDPVGQRLKFARPQDDRPWHTVIGVVGDVKQDGLSKDVKPEIYQSVLQNPQSALTMVVRTANDEQGLIPAIRTVVSGMDKDLPIYEIKTLCDVIYNSVAVERFSMLVLMIFAGIALLLATVGIYGVMSYVVTERTPEIGIRIALGAQTSDVMTMMLKQGMTLVVIGLTLGIITALLLTRLFANLLYGISASDPLTYIGIALLLGIVALLACYLPARRATRVDPIVALRCE